MMVSGLPAVNISSRLKLQPWQAAKGECDLHKVFAGGALVSALAAPSEPATLPLVSALTCKDL